MSEDMVLVCHECERFTLSKSAGHYEIPDYCECGESSDSNSYSYWLSKAQPEDWFNLDYGEGYNFVPPVELEVSE